jgi:glycerate kinase
MKIVSAMNSLKGSVDSVQASNAVAEGLAEAGIEPVMYPLADGGDGTLDVVRFLRGGKLVKVEVSGPFGKAIKAPYLRLDSTAVIESAKASGLAFLGRKKLDPLRASSIGTGQLIAHAARTGASRIVLGLGGSATNDGGLGLLMGAGAEITGTREYSGRGLFSVKDVNLEPALDALRGVEFVVASDVVNFLLGKEGATVTYGPQKGVTRELMPRLEKAMTRWCSILSKASGRPIESEQGSGAAGGMGAAAIALGGEVRLGAEMILELGDFKSRADGCFALITGEGKIDGQTRFGKAPLVVARTFKEIGGKVVVGMAGSLGEGCEKLRPPIDAFFSISRGPMNLKESMSTGYSLLRQAGREIGGLLRL